MKNLKIIIPVVLILSIAFASFLPVLKNNFTNWDDNLYVTENKAIRVVSAANLKSIFTGFFITHYQPVTVISYLVEYQLFKLNPFNYHLTNLILHLLNCLLVFWMIYLLSGSIFISCLTALLFGIHPMQVESVAWISERKNLLYSFFYLGALISYIYYLRKDKNLKYFFLCLGLFILSLLSKSMALTLPLVLILLDYFTNRKIDRSVLIEKAPHFFLSLLCGLVALLGGQLSTVFYDKETYGLFTKLMGACGDIVFYLNKLLLPLKLSVLYPYPQIKMNLFYLFCLMIVSILVVLAILSGRYSKKVIFGSGFFLLVIFPAIRFLPVDERTMADRYVYLAAVGIFYLIAQGYFLLYRMKTKYYRFIRISLAIALAGVVIFMAHSSWKRSRIWKDSLSLWGDVLGKYPDTPTAHNNRGEFYLSTGEYEKARSDFMLAINTKTKYPYNSEYKYYYLNLGNSLLALGRYQEAIAVFEQLIKEAEEYFRSIGREGLMSNNKAVIAHRRAIEAQAYLNLGIIKDSRGDKDQALALYTKAIELDPRLLYAREYLGALYFSLNRKEEALSQLLKAIDLDAAYVPAYVKLAEVYRVLNQRKELESLYKKATSNNLDFFDAYYYIGNLYSDAGKNKDAILLYRKAVSLNPGSKEACLGLGGAYFAIGKDKAAITWLKKALALDPALAVAHNNLALAYYYAHDYQAAIRHCDKASQLGYPVTPKLQELLKPYRK